ncbi:MAG: glycosyltransferase family 4 protein [Candidatus Coatesbacteria bacterium]|nr:glycosyltransferase family 4 protein [Candidatus Coatesbacteria bacterium]
MRIAKILYVCPDEGIDLFGARGCSTHVREMCRAFKSLGCGVKLLLAGDQGPCDESFGLQYETSAPPKSKKLGYDLRKIIANRRLFKRLRGLVPDFKPDVIYERYDLYSTAAATVASCNRIPYVLEVNAPLIVEQRDILHFPRVAASYQRRTFRKANLLVGVSEEVCSMLERVAPKRRVLLVENGVNEDVFGPSLSGASVRLEHGLNDRLVVGFIGSLKGWQGVRTLIRAASILLAERDDVRFLVVGGGNNLHTYRKMVDEAALSGKFFLVGPKPHSLIPSYIAAADICVAPYTPQQEFYFSPIKLLEYISCAKPIVASDLPPIRRMLTHGQDALLAKPGDEMDLAAKIAELLDDAESRKRLARSAHERFAGKKTWALCAQRVLDALEDVLGDRPS